MKEIITVCGAGTMGMGIAETAAVAGYEVHLYDISDKLLETAVGKIGRSLRRQVKMRAIDKESMNAALEKIALYTSLDETCSGAFLVIESIPEDIELKKALFSEIDKICPQETIFASNTSNISITSLASATERPDRFIGMHFFNPVPIMKLVEVAKGLETSRETIDAVMKVLERMKKVGVVCKDAAGFITSRAFAAYMLEAYRIYDEGIASIEDIDTSMKLGFNYPMGPFELSDLIGVDVMYRVASDLLQAYGDRFILPQVLIKHYNAGRYGVKTGRGFYDYRKEETSKKNR